MSKHRQLAEAVALDRLGYPLSDWIADQRVEPTIAWQSIAAELNRRTDGLVDVSWETLRTWYSS